MKTVRSNNLKRQRDISNSFPILSLILSLIVVLFILIENLSTKFQNIVFAKAAFFIVILLGIIVLYIKFREEFVKICSSLRFAIVILFFILISSIIGTLILQNETLENYYKYYGGDFYALLNFLKLTDIFHSYHFRAIVILLSVNILFCVFKRKPFNKAQLGFLLTHLGIIVILLGSSLSSFFQLKGYIHFLKGQTFNEIDITSGDEGGKEKLPLGFSVKLSDFQVEMYEKEYRLYLFERTKITDDSSYRVISSYKTRAGDVIKIPDGKTKIRIKGLLSSVGACPQGKYLLTVSSPDIENEKQICIGLFEKLGIPDFRYSVELSKFLPHFNFDIGSRQYVSL
ncbi:cytochrome c biogenesis protein ResB [bacterium]|nr:cytochrome c biogenesis protein ResB [bacterium]